MVMREVLPGRRAFAQESVMLPSCVDEGVGYSTSPCPGVQYRVLEGSISYLHVDTMRIYAFIVMILALLATTLSLSIYWYLRVRFR